MRWRLLAVVCAVASVLVAVNDAQAARHGPDRECDRTPADLALRSPHLESEAEPLLALAGQPAPYTYLLHVPAGLPTTDVPLLVAMHGLGGSSSQFAAQSRWTDTADEHGFIVAFPNGPRKWDFREDSPDVAFVRSVVADVRATQCIDSRRIWATGHSMGGFMTQRLACDLGDVFAAGASTAGGNVSMPMLGGSCNAGTTPGGPTGYEPVAIGLWHGTADQVVSYENQGRTTLRLWIERYGCDTVPAVTDLANGTSEIYGGCDRSDVVALGPPLATRFAVELRTYAEHRHGYPDGCGGVGETSLEPCTPDPDRWPTAESHNAEIHRFLSSHPRRSPAGGPP